jgi:hypothetical protein
MISFSSTWYFSHGGCLIVVSQEEKKYRDKIKIKSIVLFLWPSEFFEGICLPSL